jgi:hypothetical protein
LTIFSWKGKIILDGREAFTMRGEGLFDIKEEAMII